MSYRVNVHNKTKLTQIKATKLLLNGFIYDRLTRINRMSVVAINRAEKEGIQGTNPLPTKLNLLSLGSASEK